MSPLGVCQDLLLETRPPLLPRPGTQSAPGCLGLEESARSRPVTGSLIASYNTAAIVFIIPLYILFSKVGLLNNYLALVPRRRSLCSPTSASNRRTGARWQPAACWSWSRCWS
jgi:hypothetical protein